MTAISINAKNCTIERIKTFAAASSQFGTAAHNQRQQAHRDYPTCKVATS